MHDHTGQRSWGKFNRGTVQGQVDLREGRAGRGLLNTTRGALIMTMPLVEALEGKPQSSEISSTMDLKLKRAYDSPSKDDGCRILVDRLWPRGLRKSEARIEYWLKEIAPSTALRKWFGHDPARWEEFRKRYFAELDGRAPAVAALRERAERGVVTLVYGAKDEAHNHAVALRDYLSRRA